MAENQYIMDNNGMQMFLYQSFDGKSNIKLEMMSTDYVAGRKQTVPMVFLVSTLILGAICMVPLLIKIIIFIIRIIKKSDKHYNMQITLMQVLYAATVILLFGYVSTTVAINHGVMVMISIFAALLGIASLANGITLGVKTIKTKEMKKEQLQVDIYGVFYQSCILYLLLHSSSITFGHCNSKYLGITKGGKPLVGFEKWRKKF